MGCETVGGWSLYQGVSSVGGKNKDARKYQERGGGSVETVTEDWWTICV